MAATLNPYIAEHIAEHAAQAGRSGLAGLRLLVDAYPQLMPRYGEALEAAALEFRLAGALADAAEIGVEAVAVLTDLVVRDQSLEPVLLSALEGLAATHTRLGETDEARAVMGQVTRLKSRLNATASTTTRQSSSWVSHLIHRRTAGSPSGVPGDGRSGGSDSSELVDRLRILEEISEGNPAFTAERIEAGLALGARLLDEGRAGDAQPVLAAVIEAARHGAKVDHHQRVYLASALQLQATALAGTGQAEAGLAALDEALALRRSAPGQGADGLGDVAGALDQQVAVLREMGQADRARQVGGEAATAWRQVTVADPGARSHLADALHNLSVLQSEAGLGADALRSAQEAADLARQQVDAGQQPPETLAPFLSTLAMTASTLGDYQASIEAAQDSVAYYRRSRSEDPTVKRQLAGALNNLGASLGNAGLRADALDPALEAVSLLREVSAADSTALPDLALCLTSVGLRYSELGRREEACTTTGEATTIFRRLVADDRDAYTIDLARSLSNLSVQLGELGRQDEALAAAIESITLLRTATGDDSAPLTRDTARALENLSAQLAEAGRTLEAIRAIGDAVSLYRELAARSPDASRYDVSRALVTHGELLRNTGRSEESRLLVEEAVLVLRQEAEHDVTKRPDLAKALSFLGSLPRPDAVPLEAAEEALTLYRSLAVTNYESFWRDLATSLRSVARWRAVTGDASAVSLQQEALAVYRDRGAETGSDVMETMVELGSYLTHLGEHERAEAVLEDCLALATRAATDDVRAGVQLARCLAALATVESLRGRREHSRALMREAVERMEVAIARQDVTPEELGAARRALDAMEPPFALPGRPPSAPPTGLL